MRYQGRITDWKDDKGFGFVTPNGGGKKVFVHIKSFSNRRRRPAGNQLVTYELHIDAKGRPRGENVAFVGDRSIQASSAGPRVVFLTLVALFLAFVVGAVVTRKLPFVVLGIYLLGSLVAFAAYALDKSAARKGGWRIPENTLHFFSLVGGWPGALLAQRTLRHKSRKPSFQVAFWVTVLMNCSALGWLFTAAGARAMKSMLGVV